MKKMLLALGTALLFAACQTTPTTVPEGLSQPEMFQRAQESFGRSDYETALLYYQTFLERFPEDSEHRIAAQYEIAFIYYKQGKLDEAERRFREILARYDQQGQNGSGSDNGQGDGSDGSESDAAASTGDAGSSSADGGTASGNGTETDNGDSDVAGAIAGGSQTGQAGGAAGDSFAQQQAPGAQGQGLPEWPRVLAEKLIQKIEEQRNQDDLLS